MARPIPDKQILDAALDVIAEHGYAGATTREIAAAAGINEVTLFRRFGSKQGLLSAAVEMEAEAFKASGIEYTGDLAADLEKIVTFYREIMRNRGRVIAMLLTELPRQPDLLEVIQTPLGIIDKAATLLRRYQEEGALVEEPPLQALFGLVGPMFLGGIVGIMQPGVDAIPADPAQTVRRYLDGRSKG